MAPPARFPLAVRAVKSALNRGRLLSMRARGMVTRTLLPGIVSGGKGLCIGRNVSLAVYGELIVGDNVTLADGCAIEVGPTGRVVLGDRVFVGRNTMIVAQQLVEIGNDVLIAEHCTIRDQSHHLDPDRRREELDALSERRQPAFPVDSAPVSIGSNAWIGAGVRILKGSRLGDQVVVGANAVVLGDLPAGSVAAGIPARVLRSVQAD
jgi:acetyltransferase-like isoleucine patch superfamily enzyme